MVRQRVGSWSRCGIVGTNLVMESKGTAALCLATGCDIYCRVDGTCREHKCIRSAQTFWEGYDMPELLRRSGVGESTAFGQFPSSLWEDSNPELPPYSFVRACLLTAHRHLRGVPCLGWAAPAWHASVHELYVSLISFVALHAGGRQLLQSPAPTSQDVQSQVNQVPKEGLHDLIMPSICTCPGHVSVCNALLMQLSA